MFGLPVIDTEQLMVDANWVARSMPSLGKPTKYEVRDADIERFAISRLNADDAAAGLVLSTEAHWNQNEADWRFFLSKGSCPHARPWTAD